jgi:tetratricopeptide (TPR) repeat protein
LPTLADRELVERRVSERFPGEDEYAFRHALVRDVAYSMLNDVERASAHRLAGTWLEDAGESDAVVLAEHFDRGADPQRAVGWFRRAAEQALEGHDLAATLAHAERGASLGASADVLGALRSLEAEAHRWRGEFPDARARAIEAAALLIAGTTAWFRAIDEVMMSSGRQAAYADALAWGERACNVEAQRGDDDARTAQIICLCSAARLRFHAGDYAGADALVARIADISKHEALEPRAEAEVQRMHGARARHVGDLEGDVRGYEAALHAFESAGDARNACNARVSLGFAYVELGDVDRADEELRRALAAADRMGLPTVSMRARQNLSLVLDARGEASAARSMAEEVVAESHAQGNVRFEGWTRIYVSNAARRGGDPVAAEREARVAAELLQPTPPARAGALAASALSLVAQGKGHQALAASQEAAAILERLGGIEEFEALVRLAHAESLYAVGDVDAARLAIRSAADRIEARAARITSPRWKVAFRERVVENARTLTLRGEWFEMEPATHRIAR